MGKDWSDFRIDFFVIYPLLKLGQCVQHLCYPMVSLHLVASTILPSLRRRFHSILEQLGLEPQRIDLLPLILQIMIICKHIPSWTLDLLGRAGKIDESLKLIEIWLLKKMKGFGGHYLEHVEFMDV